MIFFFKNTHTRSLINSKLFYLFWSDLSLLDFALISFFEIIMRKFVFIVLPLTTITIGESSSFKFSNLININNYDLFDIKYGSIVISFVLSFTIVVWSVIILVIIWLLIL